MHVRIHGRASRHASRLARGWDCGGMCSMYSGCVLEQFQKVQKRRKRERARESDGLPFLNIRVDSKTSLHIVDRVGGLVGLGRHPFLRLLFRHVDSREIKWRWCEDTLLHNLSARTLACVNAGLP